MRTGFIDWQERNISLYVFETRAGKGSFVESMDVPSEKSLDIDSLSSLIDPGIGNFFLSVPLGSLTLREQNFPFSDEKKINETLSYELEGILLGNVSDYAIDYTVVGSSEGGSNVLAACFEKLKLQEILNTLSSAGIEPRVVTSLDLRLAGGNIEKLIQKDTFSDERRIQAALEEITDPTINLRQDELAYQGDVEQLRKNIRKTAVLVLILIIIFATGLLIQDMSLQRERKILQDNLNTAYRLIFPEDRRVVDIDRQFTGKMNSLIQKKAALAGIPLVDILREIAVQNKKHIILSDFSADGKSIFVKGTADSFQDVESLKSGYVRIFDGVKVMNSETTSNNKINFTIVMQEKSA